jgi:hypothetical protein
VRLRNRRSVLLAVVVAGLAAIPLAAADGDPASDYLITQPSFAPFGNDTSTANANELSRLLVDAKTKGMPLKVAVIASAYDLGSVPSLYRQPQEYADFLGQEDYYFFKDELLVVMPNGYGLYKAKTGVPAADKTTIAKLPKPNTTNGNQLIASAEKAVQALAARRGLTVSAGSASGSDANQERVEIIAGVLGIAIVGLLVRFALRRRGRHAVA